MDPAPENRYGWVVVAAGAVMGCIAAGTIFSLPVFISPILHDTGWTRASVSLAMTLGFLALGLTGPLWGAASDRYGPRPVLAVGAVLVGSGLMLAGQARSVLQFDLTYGLMVGAGGGASFAPLMATVTGWFERHRSLAVSLVSAGMGMAPLVIAPWAARLLTQHSWRSCELIVGAAALVGMLPLTLLIRRAPSAEPPGQAVGSAPAPGAVLTAPFIILAATYFFCCASHSGPLFHTVSYAISCGLSPLTAVSIYSVEGAAGLVGRVALGLLADRLGAKRVLAAGLLVQALAAGAYGFVRTPDGFYAVACVFGFAYAGVMPLYAVLIRDVVPQARMGAAMGIAIMTSSLGMSLGPLAGGAIFDAFGDYRWLYLGSLGMGLGAVAILLTFRGAANARGLVAA